MKTVMQLVTLATAGLFATHAAHAQLRTINQHSQAAAQDDAFDEEATDGAGAKGARTPGAYASQASGNINKSLSKTLPKQPKSAAGKINPRYQNAIYGALSARWKRPPNSRGSRCQVTIKQLYNGSVEASRIGTPCDFDTEARRALKSAIAKASPLPARGFEKEWKQMVTITFVPRAGK